MTDFPAQNGYHVNQPVRVLFTDYPSCIGVGEVKTIKKFGPKGVMLDSKVGTLYFRWHEIEPAGTIVPPAPQTIDHGRLDTLKRRKVFSTVHVEIFANADTEPWFTIPTDHMLSPRRIARHLQNRMVWGKTVRGRRAAQFADAAHTLLCSFRDNGFILPDMLEQRVAGWRVRLVANDAA